MSVPYRQARALRRIDRRLGRSDPHLAAMLTIFARLYASEVIVSTEQARHVRLSAWPAMAVAGAAACARWLFRRAASACAAARRRLSGNRRRGAPAV
jgi:hypothetical protein